MSVTKKMSEEEIQEKVEQFFSKMDDSRPFSFVKVANRIFRRENATNEITEIIIIVNELRGILEK